MTSDEHDALAHKYAEEVIEYRDPHERMHVVTLSVMHGIAANVVGRLERIEDLLRGNPCLPSTSEPSSRQS